MSEQRLRVLITGGGGQLANELLRSAPAGFAVTALCRSELDICDSTQVAARLAELRPGLIVNAAAYTAVDRAEAEPEAAVAANADGPARLALAADQLEARLIHLSTDFVFDGENGRPYRPDHRPAPLSAYGRSKLEGERRVRAELGESALILRTGWLYSARGHNFVNTMLRLMDEREEVSVVADQLGSPTWAAGLARAIWRAAEIGLGGTHHWSDAGVASWYDFAVAIAEEGRARGLLRRAVELVPVTSAQYPTAARRPPCSVLDKTATWRALGMRPPHWRVALRSMLDERCGVAASLSAG